MIFLDEDFAPPPPKKSGLYNVFNNDHLPSSMARSTNVVLKTHKKYLLIILKYRKITRYSPPSEA